MSVHRFLSLSALFLFLLLPSAAADEPEDAAAVWNASYGDALPDGVQGLDVTPRLPMAGSQFVYTLRFDPSVPVAGVTYQMCDVGSTCFAIGYPLDDDGDGTWILETIKEQEHSPLLDGPRKFDGGQRIGAQFFVELANGTVLEFPHGEECDIYAPEEEWMSCQEGHYFAVDIQAAKPTPWGACCVTVVAALALAGVMRRG